MLNRLEAVLYIEYLFNNQNTLYFNEYYNYLINKKSSAFPTNINDLVEEVYYRILFNENNKTIPLEEQIENVTLFYNEFKKTINDLNLLDNNIKAKLSIIDLELPTLINFIRSRNSVRTSRKGYK